MRCVRRLGGGDAGGGCTDDWICKVDGQPDPALPEVCYGAGTTCLMHCWIYGSAPDAGGAAGAVTPCDNCSVVDAYWN